MARLTFKQRAFVDEYVKDFNGTQAAIRAGYSEKTARFIASENLTKPNIKEEIDKLIQSRIMSRDEALARQAAIARFDISPYLVKYGRLWALDVQKLKDDGHGHIIRKLYYTDAGLRLEWASPDDAQKTVLRESKPQGTEDDPQHIAIKFIDYGLNINDEQDTD